MFLKPLGPRVRGSDGGLRFGKLFYDVQATICARVAARFIWSPAWGLVATDSGKIVLVVFYVKRVGRETKSSLTLGPRLFFQVAEGHRCAGIFEHPTRKYPVRYFL